MSRIGVEKRVRRRGVVTAAGSGTGVDRARRKDGKEEMTTAGVGGGDSEERADKEGRGEDEEGEADDGEGWAVTAETSTLRGEAEGVGTTRVRPSNPIV